jgi:hypothetical protein
MLQQERSRRHVGRLQAGKSTSHFGKSTSRLFIYPAGWIQEQYYDAFWRAGVCIFGCHIQIVRIGRANHLSPSFLSHFSR